MTTTDDRIFARAVSWLEDDEPEIRERTLAFLRDGGADRLEEHFRLQDQDRPKCRFCRDAGVPCPFCR